MESECIFCQIVTEKQPSYKVWEDDHYLAILDVNPVNAGHLLILPKNHVEYLFDLKDTVYTEIFKIAKNLVPPLQKATHAKRIGLAVEGFGVPHLHLHLVPVNSAGELDPKRAKKASVQELEEISKKIRQEL